MRIDQIILRPESDTILIQHTDSAGRSAVTVFGAGVFSAAQTQALAMVLTVCAKQLPPEPDSPVRTEVEQEIEELEYRLRMLRGEGRAKDAKGAKGKDGLN